MNGAVSSRRNVDQLHMAVEKCVNIQHRQEVSYNSIREHYGNLLELSINSQFWPPNATCLAGKRPIQELHSVLGCLQADVLLRTFGELLTNLITNVGSNSKDCHPDLPALSLPFANQMVFDLDPRNVLFIYERNTTSAE